MRPRTRWTLAVEIALQTVTDRLVQQKPGQPGPSTTVVCPAGAERACRFTSAMSTAWRAYSCSRYR